jgi:predicted O-methyltransferase YrrM
MFSQSWFDDLAKSNFEKNVTPFFASKPIQYLEIGCFEGNSLLYMFKNVLTHPDAHVTVIDPFEESYTHPITLRKFKENLAQHLDHVTIIKGYSNVELQKLEKEFYDLIYIDGDHTSYAALVDGILSFSLLKKGGMIVFDDYELYKLLPGNDPHDSNNPYTGINYFLKMYEGQYELVDKNWQVTIRKL